MFFFFQNSLVLPPRTPLKVRKIFCLGFFRKTHIRCISSTGVQIWNRNCQFPTRSRDIRVFVLSYYVNFRFFAFRAAATSLFFVVKGRIVLLRSWRICTVMIVLNFELFGKMFSLLKIAIFPRTRFRAVFSPFFDS